MALEESAQLPLFDRLGGMKSINNAVDIFFEKILSDEDLSHYFDEVLMVRHRVKLKAFLAMVTGGPQAYTGKNLRDAHRGVVQDGLNDAHIDKAIRFLGESFLALGVASADIDQVAAIANSVRNDILNR